MGKTTRFHPVSLNVIRGAAEYHGFKLGQIQQLGSSFDKNEARYRVAILSWPARIGDEPNPVRMQRELQNCFALDVDVTGVWFTRKQEFVAELKTHLVAEEGVS